VLAAVTTAFPTDAIDDATTMVARMSCIAFANQTKSSALGAAHSGKISFFRGSSCRKRCIQNVEKLGLRIFHADQRAKHERTDRTNKALESPCPSVGSHTHTRAGPLSSFCTPRAIFFYKDGAAPKDLARWIAHQPHGLHPSESTPPVPPPVSFHLLSLALPLCLFFVCSIPSN
jgi:hypothetical protein